MRGGRGGGGTEKKGVQVKKTTIQLLLKMLL